MICGASFATAIPLWQYLLYLASNSFILTYINFKGSDLNPTSCDWYLSGNLLCPPRPCQEPVALELPEHPPRTIWCLPAILRGTARWRTAAQNKWWPLSSGPSIVTTSGSWLSYENWHLVALDRGFLDPWARVENGPDPSFPVCFFFV